MILMLVLMLIIRAIVLISDHNAFDFFTLTFNFYSSTWRMQARSPWIFPWGEEEGSLCYPVSPQDLAWDTFLSLKGFCCKSTFCNPNDYLLSVLDTVLRAKLLANELEKIGMWACFKKTSWDVSLNYPQTHLYYLVH